MPFRDRIRDDLPLARTQAEPVIQGRRVRIARLGIGQINLGRARFEDHVAERRIGDLGEALRGENDGSVLLTQRAQPFLNLRTKSLVGEHQPGFVDRDERWPAVEPLVDPMKKVEEDGNQNLRSHRHQGLELEGDEAPGEQRVVIRIKEAAERPRDRILRERGAQLLVLSGSDEVGKRARVLGAGPEKLQRPPQRFPVMRKNSDIL